MQGTEKPFSTLPRSALKKRDKLEIIIDSCVSGAPTFTAINKIIDFTMNATADHRPEIFKEYRITIPIQLSTERNIRIFPEFLDAHLLTGTGELDRFYQHHHEHTKLVETPTSLGFKLYVGFKAAHLLAQSPELAEHVLREAQRLAIRYAPHLAIDTRALSHQHLQALLEKFSVAEAAHREAMEDTVQGIAARYGYDHAHPNLLGEVREAEATRLGRQAKDFLGAFSIEEKLLLQALYSCSGVRQAIGKQEDFKKFRADKGERAIEEYLFEKRAESDPSRVTVILSEDQKARKSIHSLRSQSQNTVFAVSNYGLARAMIKLYPDSTLFDYVMPATLEQMQARDFKTEQRIKHRRTIDTDDVLEPRIEEKWSDRLVEILKTGQWKKPLQERSGGR